MSSFPETTPPDGAAEATLARYRSVSRAAVGSLALGLLSPLALAGPMLWFIPAAGSLAAASALRATGVPGAGLTGRGLARAGLFLSLCFGVAAPVEMAAAGCLLARSAEPFAKAFFRELAEGRPQIALQLRKPASRRQAPDASLWDYYRDDQRARRELKQFVADPVVKTLLLLGDRAEARLYETGAVERYDHRESLPQIYAVTFDRDGRRATFFVSLILERSYAAGQTPSWRVAALEGPARPRPWNE